MKKRKIGDLPIENNPNLTDDYLIINNDKTKETRKLALSLLNRRTLCYSDFIPLEIDEERTTYVNTNCIVQVYDNVNGKGVLIELTNGKTIKTLEDIDASMIYSYLKK